MRQRRRSRGPAACAPAPQAGLLECDFGDWTGKKLERPATQAGVVRGAAQPVHVPVPRRRVLRRDATAHLAAAAAAGRGPSGKRVVAVSHADPIKAAVAMAAGAHLDNFQRFVVSPCSVTALLLLRLGSPIVLSVNNIRRRLARGLTGAHDSRATPSISTTSTHSSQERWASRGIARSICRPASVSSRDPALREAAGGDARPLPRSSSRRRSARPRPDRDVVGLVEPVQEQWAVGQLSVGVDEPTARSW